MLARSRAFFAERDVVEVDCRHLRAYPDLDPNIDCFQVGDHYLHASSEYGMKQLLTQDFGDCYQLSHVFRKGELGERHLPEFTMVEWYRLGFSLEQMVEETLAYCALFVEAHPVRRLSYGELFPANLSLEEQDRLFACEVEPTLTGNCFYLVTDFPPERAALAKVRSGVVRRFEIVFEGYELANGYDELNDPLEQQERLEKYPRVDPYLFKSFPDCCGVAVGFDRLMMLHCGTDHIEDVTHS